MSDDLLLPTVPEPKPEDLEDVSWALSTAEAMWTRGDHAEGIKWVRRAAEAASEGEDDARALELAKRAADLAALISQRTSRVSIDLEEVVEPTPPPVPRARPGTKPPPPNTANSSNPVPASVTKQMTSASRPAAPLAPKTSQPPASRTSHPPSGRTSTSKPLGTNTSGKPASVRPSTLTKSEAEGRKDSKKPTRRSRDNLEAAAKAAGQTGSSDTAETATVELSRILEHAKRDNDTTLVGYVDDVERIRRSSASDAGPSEKGVTGDDSTGSDGERKTAVGVSTAAALKSSPTPGGSNPPSTVAGAMLARVSSARPPSIEPHDPKIVTSQAVRVVVWRDSTGVHVAPAGTVVSAITVDAVLVALEPNADLTAWLTQKGR